MPHDVLTNDSSHFRFNRTNCHRHDGVVVEFPLRDVLQIKRTVWGTSLKEQTETREDEEAPRLVPIIEPLGVLLDAVRPEHGFIFVGDRGASLDLENLADRVMKPALVAAGLRWAGWHAYRRGLATNLKQLGVDDLVIQSILRHQDVRTTQRFYIKTVPQPVTAAMQEFASKVGCAMKWQGELQETRMNTGADDRT